jgi:hypothetical protein
MAWWEVAILCYCGLTGFLGIAWLLRNIRTPYCPVCYYPLHRCECHL